MNNTFGDPGLARTGEGHAGDDSPMVRPMRPGNVVPGGYSFSSAFAVAPVSAEAAISELPLSSKSRRLIPFLSCARTLSDLSLERSFPMRSSCCEITAAQPTAALSARIVLIGHVIAELDRSPIVDLVRCPLGSQARSRLLSPKADIALRV